MEIRYGLISSDDHVQEHPEVWTSRMSRSKFGDRIPQVQRQADGSERWVVDGKVLPLYGSASPGVAAVGATMPDRVVEPQRWEDVPKSAYDPSARLLAMDADRIDASVLFPIVAGLAGETFGTIEDPELELACVQAYNDFILEEWAAASERFIPQCIVPIYPVEAAVKEMQRCVEKGAKGLIYPAVPMHLREVPHVNEPEYDLLWDACAELQVPLSLHAGSSTKIQFPPYEGLSPAFASALQNITRPASSVMIVANMLFTRILDRHPELKVVFAESSLTWGAYELETADHQSERQRLSLEGHPVKPSELFKRQCFFTGWYDQVGVETRRHIGVDNIMWSSNFPLTTSSWPQTQTYVDRAFDGVSESDRRKMLWGNATRLYKMTVEA